MATLLIYLSDDFDGGETVFPALRGKDGKLKPPLVLKVVTPHHSSTLAPEVLQLSRLTPLPQATRHTPHAFCLTPRATCRIASFSCGLRPCCSRRLARGSSSTRTALGGAAASATRARATAPTPSRAAPRSSRSGGTRAPHAYLRLPTHAPARPRVPSQASLTDAAARRLAYRGCPRRRTPTDARPRTPSRKPHQRMHNHPSMSASLANENACFPPRAPHSYLRLPTHALAFPRKPR